jgi:hypothetical protein
MPGQKPSQGTLLKAGQFIHGMYDFLDTVDQFSVIDIFEGIMRLIAVMYFINEEELPIRLAHRVKELEELPNNLSQMPSIVKVKNWYAQSFQV